MADRAAGIPEETGKTAAFEQALSDARPRLASFFDTGSKVFIYGGAMVAFLPPPFDFPAVPLVAIGGGMDFLSDVLDPKPLKISTDILIDKAAARLGPAGAAAAGATQAVKDIKNSTLPGKIEEVQMLNLMHSVLRNARQARGPVIEKWEGFERYASLLLMLAAAVLVGLVVTGHFYGSLACLGGLVGLVIVGAYAAALAAKSTLAAVLSILVAVVGAASLVGRDSFPLWVLLSNGLSGLVLVVSATAAFTRTQ